LRQGIKLLHIVIFNEFVKQINTQKVTVEYELIYFRKSKLKSQVIII
jgi:hypothetical protein